MESIHAYNKNIFCKYNHVKIKMLKIIIQRK